MNRSLHDEKENISFFNNQAFENKSANMKFPCVQLLAVENSKKSKAKVKAQKTVTTNVRAGDWVCLVCNNLNFSFRNECNRCQVQTKKQNYIQSLLLISDAPKTEGSPAKRAPLKDVTNQPVLANNYKPLEMVHKNKPAPIQPEFKAEPIMREMPKEIEKPQRPIQELRKNVEMPTFNSNYGFENMLLVTPPKSKGGRESLIFKEYFDSNQKIFPPYKSPQQLPSISPMMRRFDDAHEVAMLKEMNQLGLGPLNDICENMNNRFCKNVRVVEREEENERSEIGDISSYFRRTLDPITRETSNFYSSDASPELTNESFEFNHVHGEDLFFANNMEESHQKQKERKMDWYCSKCGNLNYSFRKFCNRCQVIR